MVTSLSLSEKLGVKCPNREGRERKKRGERDVKRKTFFGGSQMTAQVKTGETHNKTPPGKKKKRSTTRISQGIPFSSPTTHTLTLNRKKETTIFTLCLQTHTYTH